MNSVRLPEGYKNLWDLPNLLLQKFPAEEFTATAKIWLEPRFEGERIALVVMGMDYSLVAVEYRDGKLFVTNEVVKNADKGTAETRSEAIEIPSRAFFLRVAVGKDASCRFSYSLDGNVFVDVGRPFKAREGKWIGAKVGLVFTRPGIFNDAGSADVDWFRVGKL